MSRGVLVARHREQVVIEIEHDVERSLGTESRDLRYEFDRHGVALDHGLRDSAQRDHGEKLGGCRAQVVAILANAVDGALP
jgi:hypothetical protein